MNLVLGFIGYGFMISSGISAFTANSTYNDYKQNPSYNRYNKAVDQRKTATNLAIAGAATWFINYAILGYQIHNTKNAVINLRANNTAITATSPVKSIFSK